MDKIVVDGNIDGIIELLSRYSILYGKELTAAYGSIEILDINELYNAEIYSVVLGIFAPGKNLSNLDPETETLLTELITRINDRCDILKEQGRQAMKDMLDKFRSPN